MELVTFPWFFGAKPNRAYLTFEEMCCIAGTNWNDTKFKWKKYMLEMLAMLRTLIHFCKSSHPFVLSRSLFFNLDSIVTQMIIPFNPYIRATMTCNFFWVSSFDIPKQTTKILLLAKNLCRYDSNKHRLTYFGPMSHFYTFWKCFQGVRKCDIGLKWIKCLFKSYISMFCKQQKWN